MTKKTIFENGAVEEVDLTAEEETTYQADVTKMNENKTAFMNNLETQANLKASAKAKLIAGDPLTEDEANTIVL
mgnify:CR=1 FL=1